MNKFITVYNIFKNQGLRYFSFRIKYELFKKSGLLKTKFKTNPPFYCPITLKWWIENAKPFLFSDIYNIDFQADCTILKNEMDKLKDGYFTFFSGKEYYLGKEYDWVSNPDTGYRYDAFIHWTKVNDFNRSAGDIKFVWEKSRFSYLYTVIRYDYFCQDDQSLWTFNEILNWIEKNPINCGPNYKCSQEISLRVLNWIFALYYYKNSSNLTEDIFRKILNSIYYQIDHVYKNIDFSRIAVRNNHAITETLTLYLVGLLFPSLKKSKVWKKKGKEWFEQEIKYQIYDDGSYLQFSMNYHRVVVQLLSWAFSISHANEESFSLEVYEKAYKSVNFLYQFSNESNGYLPNYGANDGALFFKLNDTSYRDYRGSLNALHLYLTGKALFKDVNLKEDAFWLGFEKKQSGMFKPLKKITNDIIEFKNGGYFLLNDSFDKTFIRCGSHKDRPSQADNLHLDIWYNGDNILHDAGSYKYNAPQEEIKYFMGSQSHNTVMLDQNDQMLKGKNFIWFSWTQADYVQTSQDNMYFYFEGSIKAFQYINPDIRHIRKIKKSRNLSLWIIEDIILNKPAKMSMKQIWHTQYFKKLQIKSFDREGNQLNVQNRKGYFSSHYGLKEECDEIFIETSQNLVKTEILILE